MELVFSNKDLMKSHIIPYLSPVELIAFYKANPYVLRAGIKPKEHFERVLNRNLRKFLGDSVKLPEYSEEWAITGGFLVDTLMGEYPRGDDVDILTYEKSVLFREMFDFYFLKRKEQELSHHYFPLKYVCNVHTNKNGTQIIYLTRGNFDDHIGTYDLPICMNYYSNGKLVYSKDLLKRSTELDTVRLLTHVLEFTDVDDSVLDCMFEYASNRALKYRKRGFSITIRKCAGIAGLYESIAPINYNHFQKFIYKQFSDSAEIQRTLYLRSISAQWHNYWAGFSALWNRKRLRK